MIANVEYSKKNYQGETPHTKANGGETTEFTLEFMIVLCG